MVRRGARRAFTLIEMLIVAALIALFAGLAVFNVTEQYELNKQKAAIAECRQIGTAMNFALQDLAFFPKLCFLRFNYNTLISRIGTLPVSEFEYHGLAVGNIGSRLRKQWSKAGGGYAAFNFDKVVKMRIPGDSGEPYDWPGDPWRNPYVCHLIHTEPSTQVGVLPKQRFLSTSSEQADYFAGVVSYGRNGVPGLTGTPTAPDITARKALRLYEETGQFNVYQSLLPYSLGAPTDPARFNDQRASMIVTEPTNPDPTRPRIRDDLSDDLVFEF